MDRNVMIERLEWLATAKRAAQADWLPDNDWQRGIAEVAAAAVEEIKDRDRSFDLRWNADMRAIKRWQAAAPGRELTWPDHADLVVWLLEQRDQQWRPIDEAPIPPAEGLPGSWTYRCLLQNARGWVGEGCARYVDDNRRKGNKPTRVLRWYMQIGRESVCPDPVYFQPLPQPRKD